MTFLLLLIYSLAVFRLAVLFSKDSGPYNIFSRLRSFLKREAKTNKPLRDSKIHKGIECLRCSSLELALPVAAYAVFRSYLSVWLSAIVDLVLVALALSASAILFHRMFPQR